MYHPNPDGTYDLDSIPTTMTLARGRTRGHRNVLRLPEFVPFGSAIVPRRDATGWELRTVDEDGRLGEVIEVYPAFEEPCPRTPRWDDEPMHLTAA